MNEHAHTDPGMVGYMMVQWPRLLISISGHHSMLQLFWGRRTLAVRLLEHSSEEKIPEYMRL